MWESPFMLTNCILCIDFFRMDEKDGETYKWLMISWSPDSASIRNKMLYASTKATLKKEFGGGQILDDLYGNVRVRKKLIFNQFRGKSLLESWGTTFLPD